MKRRIMILIVVSIFLFVGCGSAEKQLAPVSAPMQDAESVAEPGVAEWPDTTANTEESSVDVGETMPKMIIYNGELNLIVKNTVTMQEEVTVRVEEMGGYVSNSNSYAYDNGLMRVTLTLRVPAENFNAMMAVLRAMALEISSESISSQDVTQEYVDLESRLRALQAKATRLEALMEQAEDTEAVLAVYEELSATQQEIEQTKGRMRYLERSAAMATITVQLTPDELSQPVEVAGWRPAGTLKRAVEALINTFQFLFEALIWLVILVVPVVVFIGIVGFVLLKLLGVVFKRRGRKQKATSSNPPTTQA